MHVLPLWDRSRTVSSNTQNSRALISLKWNRKVNNGFLATCRNPFFIPNLRHYCFSGFKDPELF